MWSNRLVSVIIPVHNGERYLADAVDSVLRQSYAPLEVIVIDDGSTDGSASVAQAYGAPVRYAYQPHSRVGAALNHGLSLARGDFIAALDADDLWTEGKLARQMAVLEASPEPALVFGHVEQFVSPELDAEAAARLRCPSELMPGYIPGTLLTQRDVFPRVGPFETQWRAGEFLDWYLRALDLSIRVVMLPDLLLRRRLHRTNHGLLERDAKGDLTKVLRLAMHRRRVGEGAGT
jgi:glycosyltransferase involved in cell wall biosynthesis